MPVKPFEQLSLKMSDCHDSKKIGELCDIANKLRIHSITSTNAAGSGHVTSCCSCAEIMSVLFFHSMRYDPKVPRDPNSDRFIMSKGHAAPILYAAWQENGFLPDGAIQNLRKLDNPLEGHPTPRLEFVDVATGSLGQGLSCACGMAYTGKYFDKASYRVYCLIGDGESAEGSVWEAAHFASLYKLNNLVAIFDINRLGQSEPTSLQHHVETYQDRLRAFGWNTVVVDGHDVSALVKAFHDAELVTDRPTAIVAKTFKGKGLPGVEDLNDWHGKPIGDKAKEIIPIIQAQIKNSGPHGLVPPAPKKDAKEVHIDLSKIKLSSPPAYKKGDMVATRVAYGTGLHKLGQACEYVVAMDGDVKNSTFADKFQKAFPERFIQCFIAEQNLVGVSIGCGTRGRTIPFCSTFACFFARAADQLRMGAISQANIKCCGSHVGVSIGEDGPSQMALEDLAMFRSINGSTVFYPSDAVSCERAVELAAKTPGICFIRTGRPNQPVIYANEEEFHVGKAKIVMRNDADKVLIVGAGVTLTEAMKAAEKLAAEHIHACVIDPFTIKPLDIHTLVEQTKRVGGKVVVVEDHYPEGGLGEAVSAALVGIHHLHIKHLAVTSLPMSGPPEVLMDRFNISARAIVEAAKSLIAHH